MMDAVRKVVGCGGGSGTSVAGLALAAAHEAAGFGFTVARHKASRSRRSSPSRYLHLVDRAGREWCLRISNHYRPSSSPHAPPHFDLVALDGCSGLGEIRAFLLSIVGGDAQWFDRSDADRRPRQRRKRNLKLALRKLGR